MVVVLDLSRLMLRIGVVQQDLPNFSRGQSLSLHFRGEDAARTGRVHHIASVPDGKTRTFEIAIVLDNPVLPDARPKGEREDEPARDVRALRAGMLAQVELKTDESRGLFVPLLAIRRGLAGEHLVSLVNGAGRVEERSIDLGPLYGDEVLVPKGLAVGERLIVEGQGFVSAGDSVRVR